ncbi:LysM peptidoglycan-binding domain-containing protein [Sporosarcina sp. resist]|uniref:LysM peptidoglycan-binding domain-containing protein n=1 Tax=Sporosarcina sp. resist TaxID=2762563 RepID=UPI00164D16AB|nr:LysM peptidoglycan-binding domain-containing protein [Sporosarcina sp. resist]QNK87744.1 LysM peptidoglycan-binding domain-containing protein [Sporosarcina sp. resist]
MAKSKYEFWLSFGNGAEKLRLPVLPSVLNVSNSSKNESVDIAKLGEVTIIQDPVAKMFNFSSFFPREESPLIEYTGILFPWDYIKMIERWKNSGKPIRFVVTGTPINYAVSIEDFNYREGEKDVGDYDYDILLKEYKFISVRKIEQGKPKQKATRPNPKPKSKTYTVKKGDTLIAIARKHYGKSGRWRDIWNANKDAIIKRDKRNLKQPGHWIHIGAKLSMPS